MWYLLSAIAVYICVYTVSYGVWEWKNNNKPAAVAVCIVSAVALTIPAIKAFL